MHADVIASMRCAAHHTVIGPIKCTIKCTIARDSYYHSYYHTILSRGAGQLCNTIAAISKRRRTCVRPYRNYLTLTCGNDIHMLYLLMQHVQFATPCQLQHIACTHVVYL